MAARYTFRTECGEIRLFEKSIMIEGMARSYYLKSIIDKDIAQEIVRLINDAFFIGKNVKAREVSDTVRNLIHPTIEYAE